MGKRIDKTIIKNLICDREQGHTITELMGKYNLAKTTIWHHVHKIILAEDLVNKITSNRGGSRRRRLEQEEMAHTYATNLLKKSQHQRLILASIMLYWAEGHKKALVFTNTDHTMVGIYLRFLYEVLGVDKKRISLLIRIPNSVNEIEIKNFWARTLELPPAMIKCNVDEKNNKTKKNNGICRVIVAKSGYYHKVVQNLIQILQNEF